MRFNDNIQFEVSSRTANVSYISVSDTTKMGMRVCCRLKRKECYAMSNMLKKVGAVSKW